MALAARYGQQRSKFFCSIFTDKLGGKILSAMARNIKTFFLVLLLILLPLSSGLVEGFRDSIHPVHRFLYKDGSRMKWRKLFSHHYMQDYDEGGANRRHRKPGKGP